MQAYLLQAIGRLLYYNNTMKQLIITILLLIGSSAAQIYETSNDPDSLCITSTSTNGATSTITKLTGYKASKDCRGYAYCQNGYLMGGAIIPCSHPNQIFDETQNACTYWQSVSEAYLASTCPEYSHEMILPDQYDENVNQERFFCGRSWSHARSICEPCVGGSRLECGDLGYNCFAGVTGCSSNNGSLLNNSVDHSSGSGGGDGNLQMGQSGGNANVDVQNQQQPSSPAVNNINEYECTNHSDCPSNQQYCNQGYCGQCAREESGSTDIGCTDDHVCRTASCHVTQTRGPGKCYSKVELTSFCSTLMKDESYTCNFDTMVCEESVSSEDYSVGLGGVEESESAVQEEHDDEQVGYLALPIQDETSTTTSQPNIVVDVVVPTSLYTNPSGNNFFCGHSFSTVTSKCLLSKPCPNGFASKHCEATEGCFRASQCAEEYEEAQAAASSSIASIQEQPPTAAATTIQQEPTPEPTNNGLSLETFTNTPPSPAVVIETKPPPTNYWGNFKQCTSHDACTKGQFCNQGFCGQCSSESGIGCSVDQVCRTASCHETQTPGPGKCYDKEEMHSFCRTAWEDESYQCNLDLMKCETTKNNDVNQVAAVETTPTAPMDSTPSPVISSPTTAATFPPPLAKPTKTPSKAPITPLPTNAKIRCSICGHLQVVTDSTIFYDGTELSCTELVDEVFIKDGITMGSDKCTSSQYQYSAACCIDPPQNPCNLCRSGDNDLPLKGDVMAVSMSGRTESCFKVFQSLLSMREESSWQCIGSQRELQAKCCDSSTISTPAATTTSPPSLKPTTSRPANVSISTPSATTTSPPSLKPTTSRPANVSISTPAATTTSPPSSSKSAEDEASLTPLPCSICSQQQVVTNGNIFYDGSELSCTDLVDKVLIEDGITMESDKCLTSRELYSAACCIEPPQNPCNLCRSGGNDLPLKGDVMVVSMVGETESCFEVSQSLQSLREESSWQCIGSQRELQAKCCDGGSSNNNDAPAPTPGVVDWSPYSSGGNGNDQPYDYNNVPIPSPGVDWSPMGGDEPHAGSPTDEYYYKQPDWNWNNRFRNSSSRMTGATTASASALCSIMICMALLVII